MTIPFALLIISITLLFGSVIYLLVARFSPEGGRSERTPTNVYAVTGGAMSLLIAFTLSAMFAQYNDASTAAQQEANAVMSMSRAATFMSPVVRDQLRDQLVCYAEEVLDYEWPAMAAGDGSVSPRLTQILTNMDTIMVTNQNQLGQGFDLWESANADRLAAHQTRRLVAEDGVPPILMFLLIIGSVITIGSLMVFADRSKPAWGHILVIIGPLFIASAAIIVIMFFDHPYSDAPGSIKPAAMQTVYQHMINDQIGDVPLPSCPASNGS